MDAEIHPLTRADGSSHFHIGQSSYIAAVYGPLRIRRRAKFHNQYTKVQVRYRTKRGKRAFPFRKCLEKLIRRVISGMLILTNHPRGIIKFVLLEYYSQVNIVSSVALAINSACLSIIDSGLPMTYQVAAVSVAILKPVVFDGSVSQERIRKADYTSDDGEFEIVVNPDQEQSLRSMFSVMFAFENHRGEMISTYSLGACTDAQLDMCLELATPMAPPIFDLYRRLAVNRCEQLLPTS